MLESLSKTQWALVLVFALYGAMNGGASAAAMFGGAVGGIIASLAAILGYNYYHRGSAEQA